MPYLTGLGGLEKPLYLRLGEEVFGLFMQIDGFRVQSSKVTLYFTPIGAA